MKRELVPSVTPAIARLYNYITMPKVKQLLTFQDLVEKGIIILIMLIAVMSAQSNEVRT